MSIFSALRGAPSRVLSPFYLLVVLLASVVLPASAAAIHGTVTDPAGAAVHGATIQLVLNGKPVGVGVSGNDGSYQILSGAAGHYLLLVASPSFRQLKTPDFYAGPLDNVERNIVLEPEWVRESIVVTATGTPTPQAQTSEATTVLGPLDLALREDLTTALKLMPGTFIAQEGQLGAETSLFIRGGNSDSNKILLDGIDVTDMGDQFDFGPLSTTGIEQAEVMRGPDSSLYGAGAESGVISLSTPHGTTNFPSLIFQGSVGNLYTSREQLELAGTHGKLDYYGAFSWLQTSNDLPLDEYHDETTSANVGWQPNGNTQIRATLHDGVDATGVPNAWDFYHVADDRKEGDQDLYVSGTVENQTTAAWHNRFQYGLARKREQSQQWYAAGICITNDCTSYPADSYEGGNYYGLPVTIEGANGYTVVGPALLNYSEANGSVYPNRLDLITNRDQFHYQGDYRLTPHLQFVASFNYESERADEREPVYLIAESSNPSNSDYSFGMHGDYKRRLFYTFGADWQHFELFGNDFSPHIGSSFYAVRPKHGALSGTLFKFNFSKGNREPKLTDEFGSLYNLLEQYGGQSSIQADGITPITAPEIRTWEGGLEQSFWSDHIVWRINYFHNEFGREIESIGAGLIPELLPGLSHQQQQALIAFLNSEDAYSLDANTGSFRAQGVETTIDVGLSAHIFLRGGYTYLDAVVQKSFSSDNVGSVQTFDGIPLGIYSPLVGARPFRRPPHTGFLTTSYSTHKFTAVLTGAFASRSDDSTYLGYSDINQGNTLCLPNRNLDYGYAKIDLGGSYQFTPLFGIYGQMENLTNNQHIAPIGYPSLPFTFRAGIRVKLGKPLSH